MNPWWFHFFAAGYMACCDSHARNCYVIMWDIGDNGERSFKLSLN